MSLEKLVLKYISSAEYVLGKMDVSKASVNVGVGDVRRVVELAKAYLEDAKHYTSRKRFEVSLASVAYCEGLLDALKILGAVEFEWPAKKKIESEK